MKHHRKAAESSFAMQEERDMAKQNVYDNEAFFENFRNSRSSEVNFNDCIETPILFGMLPDLRGKAILDIGCGMGQHAKQFADMGAESVLGTDISGKMLEYAREHNSADNITYLQMAMEDIGALDRQFDLVTSSLVFDYAEDFGGLMRKIRGMNFADSLKEIMQAKRVTDQTLSALLGVHRKVIYNLMHAKHVSAGHVVGVCVALNLPYYLSDRLLRLTGNELGESERDALYRGFLLTSSQIGVERCNEILASRSLPRLFQGMQD